MEKNRGGQKGGEEGGGQIEGERGRDKKGERCRM